MKKDRYKISKVEKKERRITSLFMIPSIIGVLVFFVLPFGIVIYYSLLDNPIGQNFVGIDNFTRLMKNSSFLLALKNTGMFSVIAVPLTVILSLVLASMLESKIPGKSIFRTLLLSPMMVPIASIVMIWQVLFHYNGTVNDFLSVFGMAPIDWFKSDYSQISIVLLFLWKTLGYNMILFMSALANVPKDTVEMATLEGASRFTIFRKIKLRYISSSIVFVTILSLINSFKVFREVYLLTGDYPYDSLYMLQHFMNNTFASLDYNKLSAAAIIMSLAMVVIIGIMIIFDNKFGGDIEE